MKFKANEKISVNAAKNMILDNMVYSNYSTIEFIKQYNIPLTKDSLTKNINFNSKKTLEEYAEEARTFSKYCYLENILDHQPKWTSSSAPSVIEFVGEKEIIRDFPIGTNEYALSTVDALFFDSYTYFVKSVEESNIPDFISSVNKGISAIEYSLRKAAENYNIINGGNILIDDINNKVSFNDKIDKWIPTITGKKFDKSTKTWESFQILREFRNDKDQHFKGLYGFNYDNKLKLMNIYKHGIASMIFELEKMFGNRISSLIIRAKYFPTINLVKEEDN